MKANREGNVHQTKTDMKRDDKGRQKEKEQEKVANKEKKTKKINLDKDISIMETNSIRNYNNVSIELVQSVEEYPSLLLSDLH